MESLAVLPPKKQKLGCLMNFKSMAAAGASCLAVAALVAASANPATAARNRYAGMITLGYSYTDFDLQNGPNSKVNVDTFIGSGAVVYNVEGNYYLQGDFAFASHSPDNSKTLGFNVSLDTWTAGGTFFWRDPSVGMLGVDVGYQSADIGLSGDGFRVGARGEYYFGDRWTVGAAAGWEQVDFHSLTRIDGWYANAQVKYYWNDRTSFSLNGNYYTANVNAISINARQWSVGLEGEYLVSRDTPVSVYGGVRYGDFNIDFVHNDPTQWTAYVGFKFRFGNDGGSLVDQNRNGALDPTTTGLVTPFLS